MKATLNDLTDEAKGDIRQLGGQRVSPVGLYLSRRCAELGLRTVKLSYAEQSEIIMEMSDDTYMALKIAGVFR